MFILQHTPPRVNMQTAYIFQLFSGRQVRSLDTKSPGERVLLGAGYSFKRVRLFADHEENQSVFLLLGNGNAELGRIHNASLF